MSGDDREFQNHNLAFFKEMILAPSLRSYGSVLGLAQSVPVAHSIGFVEAVLWLRLGSELNFFSPEIAGDTLTSIEPQLSTAWLTLLKTGVSPSSEWCDFMSAEPQPRVIKDRFFNAPNRVYPKSAEHLEDLVQCFLGSFLLTSEVLLDPRVLFFQEMVGLIDEETWTSFINGRPILTRFSLNDLYIGFENHVRYFEQLTAHLHNCSSLITERNKLDGEALQQRVQTIVTQRRLLDREPAKTRCLRLGGEIAAMVYRPGPEWHEVRKALLSHIASIAKINLLEILKNWPSIAGASDSLNRGAGAIPLRLDDSEFSE